MNIDERTPLLGGISPAAFMRRHWQKKPLLVRQAWPDVVAPVTRAQVFALAAQGGVESRLVQKTSRGWRVRHGPLPRTALPPVSRPDWTLLVQGLDLHVPAAHEMLKRFRFVPDARLDDLMVSWASPGGGVGAHLDCYDVFLIQVQGRRRWRIGPPPREREPAWVEGTPLKLLKHFEPTQEWVLEPGDLLYLPPRWGHDGTAEGGECMTCSVGFSVPTAGDMTRDLLSRLADDADETALYRDPRQPATATPAAVPAGLAEFARRAVARQLGDAVALQRVLGEMLTEPKPSVWFDPGPCIGRGPLQLHARTKMMYDERHVFINGEAFVAGGRDAAVLRSLADARALGAAERARLSAGARELLDEWVAAGWLQEP
ncbi:MAG: cupin domain-containing protein [Rubrivivax sp.]|nr:cupin domain-containing protein [Rubrivivax sp.]